MGPQEYDHRQGQRDRYQARYDGGGDSVHHRERHHSGRRDGAERAQSGINTTRPAVKRRHSAARSNSSTTDGLLEQQGYSGERYRVASTRQESEINPHKRARADAKSHTGRGIVGYAHTREPGRYNTIDKQREGPSNNRSADRPERDSRVYANANDQNIRRHARNHERNPLHTANRDLRYVLNRRNSSSSSMSLPPSDVRSSRHGSTKQRRVSEKGNDTCRGGGGSTTRKSHTHPPKQGSAHSDDGSHSMAARLTNTRVNVNIAGVHGRELEEGEIGSSDTGVTDTDRTREKEVFMKMAAANSGWLLDALSSAGISGAQIGTRPPTEQFGPRTSEHPLSTRPSEDQTNTATTKSQPSTQRSENQVRKDAPEIRHKTHTQASQPVLRSSQSQLSTDISGNEPRTHTPPRHPPSTELSQILSTTHELESRPNTGCISESQSNLHTPTDRPEATADEDTHMPGNDSDGESDASMPKAVFAKQVDECLQTKASHPPTTATTDHSAVESGLDRSLAPESTPEHAPDPTEIGSEDLNRGEGPSMRQTSASAATTDAVPHSHQTQTPSRSNADVSPTALDLGSSDVRTEPKQMSDDSSADTMNARTISETTAQVSPRPIKVDQPSRTDTVPIVVGCTSDSDSDCVIIERKPSTTSASTHPRRPITRSNPTRQCNIQTTTTQRTPRARHVGLRQPTNSIDPPTVAPTNVHAARTPQQIVEDHILGQLSHSTTFGTPTKKYKRRSDTRTRTHKRRTDKPIRPVCVASGVNKAQSEQATDESPLCEREDDEAATPTPLLTLEVQADVELCIDPPMPTDTAVLPTPLLTLEADADVLMCIDPLLTTEDGAMSQSESMQDVLGCDLDDYTMQDVDAENIQSAIPGSETSGNGLENSVETEGDTAVAEGSDQDSSLFGLRMSTRETRSTRVASQTARARSNLKSSNTGSRSNNYATDTEPTVHSRPTRSALKVVSGSEITVRSARPKRHVCLRPDCNASFPSARKLAAHQREHEHVQNNPLRVGSTDNHTIHTSSTVSTTQNSNDTNTTTTVIGRRSALYDTADEMSAGDVSPALRPTGRTGLRSNVGDGLHTSVGASTSTINGRKSALYDTANVMSADDTSPALRSTGRTGLRSNVGDSLQNSVGSSTSTNNRRKGAQSTSLSESMGEPTFRSTRARRRVLYPNIARSSSTTDIQGRVCAQSNSSGDTPAGGLPNSRETSPVGELPYKCAVVNCSAAFAKQNQLNQHTRSHDSKKYPCDYDQCDKAYDKKHHLKRHQDQSHNGIRNFKCEWAGCGKAFFDHSALNIHKFTHFNRHSHVCRHENCGKMFASKATLASHVKSHTAIRKYNCKYTDCTKTYKYSSHLARHELSHTGEKPHTCTHPGCDKSFSQADNLRAHARSHSEERPFACTHNGCSKMFKRESDVTQHVRRVHSGVRPFICTYGDGCQQAFTNKAHLNRHIRSHTRERNFACEYPGCDKTYMSAESLTIHKRSHTGERPYACGNEGCDKTFPDASTRSRHQKGCKR